MRIAVCIKQVPILAAMEFDPTTRSLRREGVRSETSSFDVRATLKAVDLRTHHGGDVTVVTMGPPQARESLLECLALGADRALHICDPAFAGADTLATARVLAAALQRGSFDLVLCGRASVDAETGQVGPEIAEILDIPQITAAHSLDFDDHTRAVVAERETDEGYETVSASLPALVTAAEDLAPERFPTKSDREQAATRPIETIGLADLGLAPSQVGAAGSPTWVANLRTVETTRRALVIEGSADQTAQELATLLVRDHGLFSDWKVHEQQAIAEIVYSPRRHGPSEVWVVAEEIDGEMRCVVLELLEKASELARAFGSHVSAVLIGRNVRRHVDLLAAHGANRVLVADDGPLAPFDVEVYTEIVTRALRRWQPGVVLVPATGRGKDLAPRIAARLGLGLTGDCIDIGLDADGRVVQYKPAFGGAVVAPILSRTVPEMATVRPGVLPPGKADRGRKAELVDLVTDDLPTRRVTVLSRRSVGADVTQLEEAQVVIGLGKGFGGRDNFSAAQPLIDLLGAGICTTRDVTDVGWLPRQYQVGLTGRAISPKLYIAIAIRGAFEHMVGVRRAGLIVAINKNAKAPIFKQADYGIVGDYGEIVPVLFEHLERLRPTAE